MGSSFPKIRDYMDTVVPTLKVEFSIMRAVNFLVQHRVTGAPVVDESGEIVGMLTEFDCLKLLAAGRATDADVPKGTVRDYMSTKIVTGTPEMDIYYAAGLFLSNRFRRLPIVEDGMLIGAITRFDILKAIQANL